MAMALGRMHTVGLAFSILFGVCGFATPSRSQTQPAAAQTQIPAASASLSGTIASSSGQPVPGAEISARNLSTGETRSAKADSEGRYELAALPPGSYEVSVTAAGYTAQTAKITMAAGAPQKFDAKLTSGLSLSSLGFSEEQTQSNAHEQELLNKRSEMLQIHQKLGLITAFPLAATVILGTQSGRHGSPTVRDAHIALGSATAGLYFATAYYAIFAPKPPGIKSEGPTRFHKAMVWIHGPGMILTPVLGALAEAQINNNERLHGAAQYHGQVAIVTSVAYGLALVSEMKPGWLGLGHRKKTADAAP